MATSECYPFSKTGGLADVVGALSKALTDSGVNSDVFMPFYSFIPKSGFAKIIEFTVPILGSEERCAVYEKELDGVRYFALSHPFFTERKGVYGDTSFSPYKDNLLRFSLFCKALIIFVEKSGFRYDILHSHDWTASLVPYFAKKLKKRPKTVFTIHNLAYQGDFAKLDSLLIGEPISLSYIKDERINLMKGAIEESDYITTVSPTYAKEIQTDKFGCGLEDELRKRSSTLSGIINGIDVNVWSPEKDTLIYTTYSIDDLDGKKKNKKKLQKELGLEKRDDIPLIGMISRLADQKGFSELLLEGEESALERILKENRCQFAILGSGDKRFEDALIKLSMKYPNLKVILGYSDKTSHRIEASSDFFLMPSRYEPCGLNQIYSERYGTLPIAHRTGGLSDTIEDMDENPDNGTGFLFDELNADGIVSSVKRAIDAYSEKDKMDSAIKRAMKKDFSWNNSALEYKRIYNEITPSKRRPKINERQE